MELIRKKLSAIRGISLKVKFEVKKSRANVPLKVELAMSLLIILMIWFGYPRGEEGGSVVFLIHIVITCYCSNCFSGGWRALCAQAV